MKFFFTLFLLTAFEASLAKADAPCTSHVSALQKILTLSNDVALKAYLRSDSATLFDSYNNAPQVGRLIAPMKINGVAPHGSGFFIESEDGSRNTIVTSAHNFFDEKGELRFPLEAYKFELGNNINDNSTEVFFIDKIECATSDPSIQNDIYDQCRVTLNRDISANIKPIKIWNGDYSNLNGEVKSYFVGFHGHRSDLRTFRTLNECTKIQHNVSTNKTLTNCNSSKGMSGGLHAFHKNGQLYAVGIITGSLYNENTNQIYANYSVPILKQYKSEMKIIRTTN